MGIAVGVERTAEDDLAQGGRGVDGRSHALGGADVGVAVGNRVHVGLAVLDTQPAGHRQQQGIGIGKEAAHLFRVAAFHDDDPIGHFGEFGHALGPRGRDADDMTVATKMTGGSQPRVGRTDDGDLHVPSPWQYAPAWRGCATRTVRE